MSGSLERIVLRAESPGLRSRTPGLAGQFAALLRQQQGTWDMLRRGYESLATVETRSFDFDGFQVKVQFNPGRITSSSAKVDDRSIRERKCFLCPANLPEDQRGILYRDEYLVLGNPFPIFPEHFTIPHIEHRPQLIFPALNVLLDLTRELSPDYTIVYNGPRCGASAPDHLHLQAGTAGFMPFESNIRTLTKDQGEILYEDPGIRAFSLRNYLRTVIVLESSDQSILEKAFRGMVEAYSRIEGGSEEPMMNLLSFISGGRNILAMFARSKHRPSFFYAEGEDRILLSPAAVDLGGVMTLPLEKDFRRMSREIIIQAFEEVSLPEETFSVLKREVAGALRNL
jgi:hypothetical protein